MGFFSFTPEFKFLHDKALRMAIYFHGGFAHLVKQQIQIFELLSKQTVIVLYS